MGNVSGKLTVFNKLKCGQSIAIGEMVTSDLERFVGLSCRDR